MLFYILLHNFVMQFLKYIPIQWLYSSNYIAFETPNKQLKHFNRLLCLLICNSVQYATVHESAYELNTALSLQSLTLTTCIISYISPEIFVFTFKQ